LNDAAFDQGYQIQNNRIWDGQWQEVFNSDAAIYGGNNVGDGDATIRITGGNCSVNIPYNGLVVFQRVGD
jgi:1,4-alpha-glucan branching enzyme